MLFKKGELSLLWRFYLSQFLGFSFAIVPLIIFIYFFQKGFSLGFGIFLVAISNVSGVIFEIPTGVFADRFGRKKSTLIYYFLSALIFLTIPFLNSQLFLLLAFFMFGIAITFRSGAFRAWVVDNLREHKRKDLIQTFFTKSHMILAAGFTISGLIFSGMFFLFPENFTFSLFNKKFITLDIVWFVEGFVFLISGLILLSAKESFSIQKLKTIKKEFKESVKLSKKGFIYSFKHPVIFAIIMSALLSTIFTNIKWAASQPFMLNNSIPIAYFGYIGSILAIFGVFLPLISEKIVKKVKKNLYLASLTIITFIASMSILSIKGPILAFLYLFIVRADDYLSTPVEEAYFHEHTPSKQRATMDSILNLFYSFGGLIALGIGGYLLNVISPALFIFFGAFLLIPIVIVYLRIK